MLISTVAVRSNIVGTASNKVLRRLLCLLLLVLSSAALPFALKVPPIPCTAKSHMLRLSGSFKPALAPNQVHLFAGHHAVIKQISAHRRAVACTPRSSECLESQLLRRVRLLQKQGALPPAFVKHAIKGRALGSLRPTCSVDSKGSVSGRFSLDFLGRCMYS